MHWKSPQLWKNLSGKWRSKDLYPAPKPPIPPQARSFRPRNLTWMYPALMWCCSGDRLQNGTRYHRFWITHFTSEPLFASTKHIRLPKSLFTSDPPLSSVCTLLCLTLPKSGSPVFQSLYKVEQSVLPQFWSNLHHKVTSEWTKLPIIFSLSNKLQLIPSKTFGPTDLTCLYNAVTWRCLEVTIDIKPHTFPLVHCLSQYAACRPVG